jgi:hypothetical protein
MTEIIIPKFNNGKIISNKPFKILNMMNVKSKNLIVLDLDNTLINKCYECETLHKRKWLFEFIDLLFKNYNIAIWTHSTYVHWYPICKEIFGENYKKLEFICFRKDNVIYEKKLRLLKYKKIILVDDRQDICKNNDTNYKQLIVTRNRLKKRIKAINIMDMNCYKQDDELKMVYDKINNSYFI